MKKFPIALQLYSVRDFAEKDMRGTLQKVKALGYDGVEFAGLYGCAPEEVKAMCLKAMHVVPQVRFVAWDVAITPDGPVFIEGNSFPSHAIPQFAAHFPDGIGILPRFEAFIDL